jgi:RNA polymerase sigma-70 factor (family 1)
MTDNSRLFDEELIEGLQDGNEDSFTTIYKKYWYAMFLVAYRKLQNKEIAEELVQDIFTRLWKERDKRVIINLEHYLFSAVRFEVIDYIRSNGTRREYLEYYVAFSSFENCDTENTIAFNDLVKSIDEGLNILPEKSRQIFKLHKLENWSVDRIAVHFSLSEKAVEYHLTKATKSLRIYLRNAFSSSFLLFHFLF